MVLRKRTQEVQWFMNELGARVVAETGIPTDRFHLGKLILRSFKDAPDFVLQIDSTTGKSETFESVLKRSIQCALAFKKLGLKTGDNIVLLAPNHLDLTIPFYAALYLGLGIAPLDADLNVLELQSMFRLVEPKILFCQKTRTASVKEALKNENFDTPVITFDENVKGCILFSDFMDSVINGNTDAAIESFKASDFDPAEIPAMLVSTSGTTGLPKCAALTHRNFSFSLPNFWYFRTKFPMPTRCALIASPLQWLSAGLHFLLSPLLRYTRLQNPNGVTPENFVEMVNKYKPTYMLISPPMLTLMIRPENIAKCDLSCFKAFVIGGSAVSKELLEDVRKISPDIFLWGLYGLSEIAGPAFFDEHTIPGSVGRPVGNLDYRLVHPETKKDITEPFVHGELWVRGPSVFKGYYNKPEATKETFDEDGWLKTGDILYRDENYFFFYVERLKMLLKYRNHQISPVELETVIRQHPGVMDVAVTGIASPEDGELPVACVVKKIGHQVTAQEIKDLVKNNLTDTKQLRGGVIFMKEFPMTASTKIHRRLLKEMVPNMTRE